MTSERAVEPLTDDDLVDPPDPAVWEGAMRCDICGHIEVHANHAATPAPREDGWEELRREIEALPERNDGTFGEWSLVLRSDVLASLAAARGEPPERTYTQAEHDESERQLRDCYDRMAARGEPGLDVERLQEAAQRFLDADAADAHLRGRLGRLDEQKVAWREKVEARDALDAALATPTTPEPGPVRRSRGKFPGWSLDPDPLTVDEPKPEPRRLGCSVALLALIVLLSSWVPGVSAEEPPKGEVGTALYSASATWCAPTPDHCQSWGGNARLAAVNSFRFGDEPYPVRVWRGDMYVDVTVVSFCACHGELGYIDLSPAAFEMLAPLSRGRIDVEVEVLTDLPPHPDDERMRDEVRDPLPATDTAP